MNIDTLKILTGLNITDAKDVIKQGFIGTDAQSAGCWIKTQDVNSICKGTVIYVGRENSNNMWTVTVALDTKRWVRYCCLSAAKVIVGNEVSTGTSIGYAHRGLMRFEYCTATKTKFPVRLSMKQLYKTDPSPILFGQVKLSEEP